MIGCVGVFVAGERAIKALQEENARLNAVLLAKKQTDQTQKHREATEGAAQRDALAQQIAFFQLVTGMSLERGQDEDEDQDGSWKCHIRGDKGGITIKTNPNDNPNTLAVCVEIRFTLRIEEEEVQEAEEEVIVSTRHFKSKNHQKSRLCLYAYTPLYVSPKLLEEAARIESNASLRPPSQMLYHLTEEMAFEEPLMTKFMWRMLNFVMTGNEFGMLAG